MIRLSRYSINIIMSKLQAVGRSWLGWGWSRRGQRGVLRERGRWGRGVGAFPTARGGCDCPETAYVRRNANGTSCKCDTSYAQGAERQENCGSTFGNSNWHIGLSGRCSCGENLRVFLPFSSSDFARCWRVLSWAAVVPAGHSEF
jgi:hypothetical protein